MRGMAYNMHVVGDFIGFGDSSTIRGVVDAATRGVQFGHDGDFVK